MKQKLMIVMGFFISLVAIKAQVATNIFSEKKMSF